MTQTSPIRKLLVIRLGAMGDVLHASASARALKARFPQVEIHWLTWPVYEALAARLDGVNRVWRFERGPLAMARLIRAFRACGIDAVVNLQPSARMRLLAAAVLAPRWDETHLATYRKQRLSVTGLHERSARRRHATEDFFQPFCRLFNMSDWPSSFEAGALLPRLRLPVESPLTALAGRRIALIPGVGAKRANRAWPTTYAAQLSHRLLSSPDLLDARLFLVGGRDDRAASQAICEALAPTLRARVENRCGQDDLMQTAFLLAGCHLVIGADTGPTHLAAAVGAPLVALFGPTSAQRTGPRGEGPIITLTPPSDLACWPCERPVCLDPQPSLDASCHHFDAQPACMAALLVDATFDACQQALKQQ
ncbi:MAG: glycosyltransferase family 9 protein [Vampirovibrionales bacterium]|nr:glycosyltransferase family 9 protein [Vampirovibrionales bacterium]